MNSKTLIFAAASAAVIAMSGCTTTPPYPVDAGGKTQVDCRMTLDCQVKLSHSWWKTELSGRNPHQRSDGQTVTITWTIQGNDGTTFNPDGGITLEGPVSRQAAFSVRTQMSRKSMSTHATNNRDLSPDGSYEYGIKTKGFFSGPNIDPVIKNGA